jgi:hypothetical protein
MPRADKKSMRVRHGNDRAGGTRRVGGADRQHQALGKARRPPTAESQAKMMDDGVEPPRPAPDKEHGLVKAFGENPSAAFRRLTARPARQDTKAHAPA